MNSLNLFKLNTALLLTALLSLQHDDKMITTTIVKLIFANTAWSIKYVSLDILSYL